MKMKTTLSALALSLCLTNIIAYAAPEITQKVNIEIVQDDKNAFETRFDEFTALLNWAAYLSGYKTNGVNPRLVFKSHQFFVDNACQGYHKCKVVGWYNDQGIVYIDDRMSAMESRFARSLVVHEFVHYLQHISGNFESGTCESFVQREREAYSIQRRFIMTYGVAPTMSFHQHSCAMGKQKEEGV